MKQNYMQGLLNKYGKTKKTEPRMVQYAREYAKKVEEKQDEQKTGKEKKIRLQNGKM